MTAIIPSDAANIDIYQGYIRAAIAHWPTGKRTTSVTAYQDNGIFGLILSAPDPDDAYDQPITIGMPSQDLLDQLAEQHHTGTIWIDTRLDGSPVVRWQVGNESSTYHNHPSILD